MMKTFMALSQNSNCSCRQEFETGVKDVMKNGLSSPCPFDVDRTFEYCMAYGYAVVLPVNEENPNGIVMVTNIYRTEVQFMR